MAADDLAVVEHLRGDRPIRTFVDSGIQSSINAALAGLSPSEHGAVIAFADGDAVRLATVAKLGHRWSVVGVLSKKYTGAFEGEAAVKFSW